MTTSTGTTENGWFWKLFGPAIIGIISVLILTVFNHLNGNISSLRSDMLASNIELRNELKKVGIDELTKLREKVASLEEKINTAIKSGDSNNAALIKLKDQLAILERAVDLHKEQISQLKERTK